MNKKKILLMSDDLRMHSGVATVSRDIVFQTADRFDWVQLAGAIKHPDGGRVFDMSEALQIETGIENPYLKIYPINGYGNPMVLREI